MPRATIVQIKRRAEEAAAETVSLAAKRSKAAGSGSSSPVAGAAGDSGQAADGDRSRHVLKRLHSVSQAQYDQGAHLSLLVCSSACCCCAALSCVSSAACRGRLGSRRSRCSILHTLHEGISWITPNCGSQAEDTETTDEGIGIQLTLCFTQVELRNFFFYCFFPEQSISCALSSLGTTLLTPCGTPTAPDARSWLQYFILLILFFSILFPRLSSLHLETTAAGATGRVCEAGRENGAVANNRG